jgi:hypothetical protein
VQQQVGDRVDDLRVSVTGPSGSVLIRGQQCIAEHGQHGAHRGGDQRRVARQFVSARTQVLQVIAQHRGVLCKSLPKRAGRRRGGQRRLEQGGHHRAVVPHHGPRRREVRAQLVPVGQVMGRIG